MYLRIIYLQFLISECKIAVSLNQTLANTYQINIFKFFLKFNNESNQKYISGILLYLNITK